MNANNFDVQLVVEGDTAQAALLAQGYVVADSWTRRGIRWVRMFKKLSRPCCRKENKA